MIFSFRNLLICTDVFFFLDQTPWRVVGPRLMSSMPLLEHHMEGSTDGARRRLLLRTWCSHPPRSHCSRRTPPLLCICRLVAAVSQHTMCIITENRPCTALC